MSFKFPLPPIAPDPQASELQRRYDLYPELLAALKEITDAQGECACSEGFTCRKLRDPQCVYCDNKSEVLAARAVLAKAEAKS